jgi:hypothetical protein
LTYGFDPRNKLNRHPEELGAKRRASRRTEARTVFVAILRDGRSLRERPPQDDAEFVSRALGMTLIFLI